MSLLAFIFESVGAGEWIVLLAVLLVVMGPKRLPATARKIGAYYSKFRRAADSFKRQLMDMDSEFSRSMNEATREIDETAKSFEEPMAEESQQEEPPMPEDYPSDAPVAEAVEPIAENPVANEAAAKVDKTAIKIVVSDVHKTA